MYYHNNKDYRRKPDEIRYYPETCPNGSKCPNNPHCDMSHSLFENLYHPLKYKVNACDKIIEDHENDIIVCQRGDRCAFYHNEEDQRKIATNGCKINKNSIDRTSPVGSDDGRSQIHSDAGAGGFAPFSPHEEIDPSVGVYQRKHARSDYLAHPLPTLSQPIAIGRTRRIQPTMSK